MFDIPTVLMADEILDKAFRKASKVEHSGATRLDSVRATNISKIKSSSDIIVTTMGRYVKAFPSIDRLSPFYSELIDVTISRDKLKKCLGALDWSRGNVARVARQTTRDMAAARNMEMIDNLRNAAYGRMSSFVKQVRKELVFLGRARDTMRKFPAIDPSVPTAVIAGAPNVGKSQLVGQISTVKPRVAVYPFTTQEISVGVFERKYLRYQIIDTPGLLDRPFNERNTMELRAVLALKYLAHVVVFVLDLSETCGYTVAQQNNLLSDLRSEFGSIPIIEVENKTDLLVSESDRMKISASTGAGVPELIDALVDHLKPQ
ncbi:MAG: GTPase [Thermoplasmata archaeon]